MSSVQNSSKSKKSASKSKSNHNPATPETHTSPAHAHSPSASPTDTVAGLAAPSASRVAAAAVAVSADGPAPPPAPPSPPTAQVIAALDALEASLNLDIVIAPNSKHQIGALNRVTDTAIGLASDIVSAAPARFPDFADLPAAASYVQSMGQIASRATELATHVQKSVTNQRAPAATKTLALYAVVKGLGRITNNETMREKIPLLKAEVAPKHANPKPKESKGEKAVKKMSKAAAKRLLKAQAIVAAAGMPLTPAVVAAPATTTPSASPSGSAPASSTGLANGAAAAPPASH